MKAEIKLVLGVIASIWVFTAQGQMTLSLNEMPTKSSSIIYSNGNDTLGLDHSKGGSNQTWDYSQLDYTFQATEEYKTASSINIFFFSLGTSAFGTKVADSLGVGTFMLRDIYDVYKTTSKRMTAEGRSLKYNGVPIPVFYEDKDEVYTYPFSYGDTSRDNYKVRFSLGTTFTLVQTGLRQNIAEGWGTLKTPNRTYSNALKIKTTVTGTDSLITSFISLPIPRNTIEYKWFVKDVKGPVLVVSGTEVLGNFTVNTIRFQDDEVPLVGFTSNKLMADTNDIVSLADTSVITPILRTWSITPSNVEFLNGTGINDENPEVRFTKPGKYTVELSIRNRYGLMTEKKIDYIEVSLPIDYKSIDEKERDMFKVYPNPFSNRIVISDEFSGKVRIRNVAGELVFSGESNVIDGLEDLPSGYYTMELEEEGQIQSVSLLKY